MESSQSKAEVLKPVILKAGIPLAVSLAGVIYAWMIAKKSLSKATSLSKAEPNSPETDSCEGINREESFHSLAFLEREEEYSPADSSALAESLVTHENPCFEQEINVLRGKIEELQMRELALRLQFDRYCDLKERESMLSEARNTLSLDAIRAEFLNRELASMEEENKMLQNFLVEYLRVIEQLEFWKSENRLLQRKVKKLLRKSKAQSRLAREQTLMIKAGEAEILRNRDALQTRNNVISKLEGEVREMQRILDQLQEKNELLKKLDTEEKSYASKIEAGIVSKEDYDKVLNELEQLKKDRAAEVKDLICLRWANACLRHELMRRNEQQKQQNHDRDNIELDFEGDGGIMHYESDHLELDEPHLEHHHLVPCSGTPHIDHSGSRRKKLLQRLKKWVEGGEKERVKSKEKDRHEYDTHSVSCGAEQPQIPSRLSCSSA